MECYGKTMEKLWNFFSGDLYELVSSFYKCTSGLKKKKGEGKGPTDCVDV